MGKIMFHDQVYSSGTTAASGTMYDNTNSGLEAINVQDAIDELEDGNGTPTFTSADVPDGESTSWTTVPALTSGETHKSIFQKTSQMFKNIRYLWKMMGNTDISTIGNGTVTNAISTLNSNIGYGIAVKSWYNVDGKNSRVILIATDTGGSGIVCNIPTFFNKLVFNCDVVTTVQLGSCNEQGTLPTIITTGANRLWYVTYTTKIGKNVVNLSNQFGFINNYLFLGLVNNSPTCTLTNIHLEN